ncbi:PQQ-binding-like beta-propeller repeat protein [Kitasatospora sp. NPDC059327]|uniref:outer membrane protein assembly factor BamB family protein n=1 Tax=Kitasatospora sp. NPDC059327 TaxID=3346803 RepID=UPI0036C4B5DE
MSGDHPTPGAGDTSGTNPQDNRGVSLGRTPGGTDPAAVANQMTRLDGAPVPGQAGPAAPGAAPGQPPAPGSEYAYAPTAAAFPAQGAPPPPPGMPPVGPYDPGQPPFGAPGAGQQYGYTAPPQADGGAGYGYPQQPAPGYGFPGAPTPAAPKPRNPVMIWGGIIGGVLAVAIVAGLVVLFTQTNEPDNPTADGGTTSGTGGTTGGSTTDPSATAGTGGTTGGGGNGGKAGSYSLAWTAAKPANAASGSQLLGVWGADKTVVRADSYGIRALNSADGKELWTITPPAGAKEFCAVSYGVNSKHIAAVALNTGDSDCSTVGAVDISTGKLLWSAKVSTDRMSSPTLSVTEKVIGIGGNVAGAVNIADGSPVWQFQPRDKDCNVYGKAAGNQIAVSDRCYGSNANPKSQLVLVDTDTGKATSAAPIPLTGSIERVDKVVSDQPLVLLVTNGPNGDYILPFDKSNKPLTPMSVKEPGADSLRLSGQSDAFTQNVVSGTTLYVQTNPSKPAVNAYDLTTGKRLWSSTGGTNDGIRLVSGTDKDGKVRAVLDMGYGKDAKVVTLSPTDGAGTELGTITSQKGADFIGSSTTEYVLQSDGSLYGFARGASSDAPVVKYAKK